MKVRDQFDSGEDFQLMLDTAKQKANGSREEDFIAGLQDRYNTWGLDMFLSDAQSKWLLDIARR